MGGARVIYAKEFEYGLKEEGELGRNQGEIG
jgi:hypothetical protein